jgi:hypothetical protein
MEDFLIVPRSGRIAVPNPRARKDAWLAIDTGPTIGERAAAADAMRAWLESKPSLDEWRRQRTRERTLRRQQWWEQQKRRASSSPQPIQRYVTSPEVICQTTRGVVCQLKTNSAVNRAASTPATLQGDRRGKRISFDDKQTSETWSVEEAMKLLAAEEPSEDWTVEEAKAALAAAKQAAAEAATAVEAAAADEATAETNGSRPHCAAPSSPSEREKVAMRHTRRQDDDKPSTKPRPRPRPEHCVTWPCSIEEVRRWTAASIRAQRGSDALSRQWKTQRVQSKAPASDAALQGLSRDPAGAERAAAARAAKLAKARASREAAEKEVQETIAGLGNLWRRGYI